METEKVVINIEQRNLDTEIKNIPGKNGNFNIKEQTAMMNCDGQRLKITMVLGEDELAYPLGDYEIDYPKSITVNKYGNLEFARRIKLVPIS